MPVKGFFKMLKQIYDLLNETLQQSKIKWKKRKNI